MAVSRKTVREHALETVRTYRFPEIGAADEHWCLRLAAGLTRMENTE
jgi:hypothetical protein